MLCNKMEDVFFTFILQTRYTRIIILNQFHLIYHLTYPHSQTSPHPLYVSRDKFLSYTFLA